MANPPAWADIWPSSWRGGRATGRREVTSPALARRCLLARARPWLGEGGATWRDIVVPGRSGTLWEQCSLARALYREHPDVFFAPGYTAPLTGRMPVVLSIHDVSFAAHPEWFPWRQGVRRRWLTRQSANRAARVLTLSAFSREEIVQRLGTDGQRITVTPLAADSHPSHVAGPGHRRD